MNTSFPNRWSFSYLKFTKYLKTAFDSARSVTDKETKDYRLQTDACCIHVLKALLRQFPNEDIRNACEHLNSTDEKETVDYILWALLSEVSEKAVENAFCSLNLQPKTGVGGNGCMLGSVFKDPPNKVTKHNIDSLDCIRTGVSKHFDVCILWAVLGELWAQEIRKNSESAIEVPFPEESVRPKLKYKGAIRCLSLITGKEKT